MVALVSVTWNGHPSCLSLAERWPCGRGTVDGGAALAAWTAFFCCNSPATHRCELMGGGVFKPKEGSRGESEGPGTTSTEVWVAGELDMVPSSFPGGKQDGRLQIISGFWALSQLVLWFEM
ncbi:hypothetical protein QTO34_011422 [Cnephaeus nilssonii]|uniref:Uncharacterized protein n=1 Tax=Cnephaeus nilssonii TaxID=3371016 RepID=A0AA40HDG6_CNENI|nr:hypothetical protein QTO34_011422 [Eptesicus nilssonii]